MLSVSARARWLHVAAIAFCRDMGLNGQMTDGEVRFLVGSQGVPRSCVDELVSAGLWGHDGDQTYVASFEGYIATPEAVRQQRHRKSDVTPERDKPVTSSRDETRDKGRDMKRDEPVTDGVTPLSPPHPPYIPKPSSENLEPTPQTPQGARDGLAAEYREWVLELNSQTDRHFRGDRKSENQYRLLRRGGMSREDLWALAAGAALSPFHRGENKSGVPYQDPITLLRSSQMGTLIELGRGELKARQVNGAGEDDWKMHSWALHPELAPGAEAQ